MIGKRVLITGGAGFIGSHLCDRILAMGNEVVCLDNYFTGRKANIIHLIDNPYFEVIRQDVIHPFFVEVDEIFHLACPASPRHYQENPIKTIKTNVMGSINALGLAKRIEAPILQASTSEVYGDPEVHPQPESYHGKVNPIGQRACYDEGKRCAESLFMNYHLQNGVAIKIARIFNTFGPRMGIDDGRVVSNFIVQALCNKPITVYGDGRQSRSFCYVTDLINGLLALMATPEAFTGPVNIGNPVEWSILELARKVLDLTGSRSKIELKPLPADDPKRRCPDISLAKKELGWEPTVSQDEGLKATIAYFEELLTKMDRIRK
jgi:UDP-glucuronate decarboxylase